MDRNTVAWRDPTEEEKDRENGWVYQASVCRRYVIVEPELVRDYNRLVEENKRLRQKIEDLRVSIRWREEVNELLNGRLNKIESRTSLLERVAFNSSGPPQSVEGSDEDEGKHKAEDTPCWWEDADYT